MEGYDEDELFSLVRDCSQTLHLCQGLSKPVKENVTGLFLKLKPYIEKYLVKDLFDWKRSFGRPTRSIKIELNFEEFDPNTINFEDSWDVDTYKLNVKDEINNWLSILKEKDVNNWLIVVIVNADSRVKSKLLRNSTYDKVKSDFCSKHVDRCIMLCEPLKNDARSMENWNAVGSRMRMLTVDSYTRLMDKFEENMRMQRERRVEVEWNFCSYFLLQEELAFMYEMLGLFQDALIQYDELDALFTQFVLNSSIAEAAPWLERMSCNQATRWDGVCLCRPLDLLKQNSIATNKCSLLDLRSYLFGRQSYLLLRMSRVSELLQRAVPFMLNFIKEVKLLQLTLPPGAINCWIFLSCMEILKVCCPDNKFQRSDLDRSHFDCELWNLAKSKLSNLGRICGLMVGGDSQPSSDHLMVVIDLLPGLVHTAGESSHLNRLLEALSSKKAFTQYYLELLEQCICSLKHVGRLRSAKYVGKELAEFYLLIEDYGKAEPHLTDALKTYKLEGWEMLANHTRFKIALCQKKLNELHKYCRTCLYISSSVSMSMETRIKFLQELIDISKSRDNDDASLPSSTLLIPPPSMSIKLMLEDVKVDDSVDYRVNVLSNLPVDVSMRSILIYFTCTDKQRRSGNSEKLNVRVQATSGRSNSSEAVSLSRMSSLDPSSASSPNTTPHQSFPQHHPLQSDRLRNMSGQSGKYHARQSSMSSALGGFELINRIAETVSINFQPVNMKETVHYFEDDHEDDDEDDETTVASKDRLDRMKDTESITSTSRNKNSPDISRAPMFSALVCKSPLQRLGSHPMKPAKDVLPPPPSSSSSSSCSSSSSTQHHDCVIFKLGANDDDGSDGGGGHNDGDGLGVVLKSGLSELVVPGHFQIFTEDEMMAGFKQKIKLTIQSEAEAPSSGLKNAGMLQFVRLLLPSQLLLVNGDEDDGDGELAWIKDADDRAADGHHSTTPTKTSIESFSSYKLSGQGRSALVRSGSCVMSILCPVDHWMDSQTLTHKMVIRCADYNDDVHELTFRNPFKITHQILTAVQKKYLKVVVQSQHRDAIELWNWKVIDSKDNESNNLPTNQSNNPPANQSNNLSTSQSVNQTAFQPLNGCSTSNKLIVLPGKFVNLVWLLSDEVVRSTCHKISTFIFSADYKQSSSSPSVISSLRSDKESHHASLSLTYSFQLADITTHYITSMNLEKDDAIVNQWLSLQLIIKQLTYDHHDNDIGDNHNIYPHHHRGDHHLHYAVTCSDDDNDGINNTPSWALSGEIKGLVDFQAGKFEVSMLCKPLKDEILKIPKVLLFHCHSEHKRQNKLQLHEKISLSEDNEAETDNDDDEVDDSNSFDADINDDDDENTSGDFNSNPLNDRTRIRKSQTTLVDPVKVYNASKCETIQVKSFNKPQIFIIDRFRSEMTASESCNTYL
ncbi:hypothetical protein HELRODRAFT_187969 [Helobdella robusta]|uniref:TRAPPC10/Trs130 N-terminal domain-containing protein n=1 Tax=Helobdella robusta TaxID=6412 RepID=T1FPI6_HELRO|nr:hypothetical protein HELRODRAFT_187969 [Helobdella robusta]ESO12744.1 hypothetical protein HELRODRAFT_187969 [Helobdella robusta]